jgi:hypothetical protein
MSPTASPTVAPTKPSEYQIGGGFSTPKLEEQLPDAYQSELNATFCQKFAQGIGITENHPKLKCTFEEEITEERRLLASSHPRLRRLLATSYTYTAGAEVSLIGDEIEVVQQAQENKTDSGTDGSSNVTSDGGSDGGFGAFNFDVEALVSSVVQDIVAEVVSDEELVEANGGETISVDTFSVDTVIVVITEAPTMSPTASPTLVPTRSAAVEYSYSGSIGLTISLGALLPVAANEMCNLFQEEFGDAGTFGCGLVSNGNVSSVYHYNWTVTALTSVNQAPKLAALNTTAFYVAEFEQNEYFSLIYVKDTFILGETVTDDDVTFPPTTTTTTTTTATASTASPTKADATTTTTTTTADTGDDNTTTTTTTTTDPDVVDFSAASLAFPAFGSMMVLTVNVLFT